MMGPGTLGLAATQVNIFVNTLLATSQGTGAVSWLTYAFRLMYLPIGLFGVSIATRGLAGPAPARTRRSTTSRTAYAPRCRAGIVDDVLMLNIPATLGLLVAGGTPIVELLFERGRFTAAGHRRRLPRRCGSMPLAGSIGYSAARDHRVADVLRASSQPRSGRRQRAAIAGGNIALTS